MSSLIKKKIKLVFTYSKKFTEKGELPNICKVNDIEAHFKSL